MIIGELLVDGYPLEDATTQVDEAKDIIVNNDIVKIIYSNGMVDVFEIEYVKKLKLIK